MFLLMFMVHPFDVLNILIGHIVFYRFVIGGAYYEDRFHSRLHSQFTYFVSIYSQSFFHQFKGFFGTNIETSSNWRVSSVGKALRRYRKGHGFKSRTGLYAFFKSYFLYCSSSAHHCEVRFHSRSTRDGEISHVGTVQTIPRISS